MRKGNFVVFIISLVFIFSQFIFSEENEWDYLGLSGKPIRVLTISPHNTSTLYAGTFYRGLHKSTDGGYNWIEYLDDPDHWGTVPVGSMSSIEIDYKTPGIVYVLSYSGLWKTIDDGENWVRLNYHPYGVWANILKIDPKIPSRLYIGMWHVSSMEPESVGGIRISTDGGENWSHFGLAHYDIADIIVDPNDTSIIYVMGGTESPGLPSGVFVTRDAGFNWNFIPESEYLDIRDLAISPTQPSVVYFGTLGNGIFISTDFGTTWNELNSPMIEIDKIVVAPSSPRTISVNSDQGIFITKDGGQNWTQLPDLSNVSTMVFHPFDSTTLFAGTWHGFFDGDGVFSLSLVQKIECLINIDPNTLNKKSNGGWITAYIELPEGNDVNDIDIKTVVLEYDSQNIKAEMGEVQGNLLMVKFSRQSLISILYDVNGDVELKVTGKVANKIFEGTDTIKVK